jgi:hypothetical protein
MTIIKLFICKNCLFSCGFESDYKRHIKTKKHAKNVDMNHINNINNINYYDDGPHFPTKSCEREEEDTGANNDIYTMKDEIVSSVRANAACDHDSGGESEECVECECGKSFKSSGGLRKHKRQSCSIKDNIIMKLIKDNAEMKELMREQQKFMRDQQEQYHKQLVEMIPMVCATNNTNLITNNHHHTNIKQKFNLNVFLNEQCKDALNIGDFINSLQISLDDLNVTREKTLEDSVENIFLRGLKELDIYKRPIHCTDHKRDIMYIKDEEKWEKDEGNIKLKGTIGAISRKQIKKLKEWKDSDPEVEKTTSVKNDKFLLTLNHVCTPIPENSEKRLIKTIGKEVQID